MESSNEKIHQHKCLSGNAVTSFKELLTLGTASLYFKTVNSSCQNFVNVVSPLEKVVLTLK